MIELLKTTMLFDYIFWKDFLSNGLATLLGALVGVPVALWINRKLENKLVLQKEKDLLVLLQETLKKNKGLLEQMLKDVKQNYVIFYNVDTSLLESTASLKYEIINDLEINRRLDTLRYELNHLHRKVALQLEITYSGFSAMTNYSKMRNNLTNVIQQHIPLIIKETKEILLEIKKLENTRNKTKKSLIRKRAFRIWRKSLPVIFIFVLIHFLKDITQDILKVSTPLDLFGDAKEDLSRFPSCLRLIYLYGLGSLSLLAEIFLLVSIPAVWKRKEFSKLEKYVIAVVIFLIVFFIAATLLDPKYKFGASL